MMSERCANEDFKAATCASDGPNPSGSGPDVRLSTAALVSARFPIISPAGTIRMKDASHGDSVVDGGYFENSGLTSALDIAESLHTFGITPIVLSIANDPTPDIQIDADVDKGPVMPSRRGIGPAIAPASVKSIWVRMLGTIYAPVFGLYNTRLGHADEAGALVVRRLQGWNVPAQTDGDFPKKVNYASFFPIRVYAKGKADGKDFEMPDLSMSWWLSPVVQAALNAQVDNELNANQFILLTTRLDGPGKQM
jgi:hypothetical protein